MNETVHWIIPKNQHGFVHCGLENIVTELADGILVNVAFMMDRVFKFDRQSSRFRYVVFHTLFVDTQFIAGRGVWRVCGDWLQSTSVALRLTTTTSNPLRFRQISLLNLCVSVVVIAQPWSCFTNLLYLYRRRSSVVKIEWQSIKW